MTNDKELDAKILRYHFVEHWGVNTIADQLGIHHTTVDRVLCQAGMPEGRANPTGLDCRPLSSDDYRDAGEIPQTVRRAIVCDGAGAGLHAVGRVSSVRMSHAITPTQAC